MGGFVHDEHGEEGDEAFDEWDGDPWQDERCSWDCVAGVLENNNHVQNEADEDECHQEETDSRSCASESQPKSSKGPSNTIYEFQAALRAPYQHARLNRDAALPQIEGAVEVKHDNPKHCDEQQSQPNRAHERPAVL
jgi:hypothetical protein